MSGWAGPRRPGELPQIGDQEGIGGFGGGGSSGGGGIGGPGGGDESIRERLVRTVNGFASAIRLEFDPEAATLVQRLVDMAVQNVQQGDEPFVGAGERLFKTREAAIDAAELSLVVVLVAASAEATATSAPVGTTFSWSQALKEPHLVSSVHVRVVIAGLCPGFWPFC